MQLVIRRYREGVRSYKFRINARMVIDAAEASLIEKYNLHNVALTGSDRRRDQIWAALITVPVWAVLSFLIKSFLQFVDSYPSDITFFYLYNIALFAATYYVIFQQIRGEVLVADLLAGRDFRARSFINLLEREYEIRKMSDVFAHVVADSQTWQEPEVIELAPVPLLNIIKA